jgi:hypothetical protein
MAQVKETEMEKEREEYSVWENQKHEYWRQTLVHQRWVLTLKQTWKRVVGLGSANEMQYET